MSNRIASNGNYWRYEYAGADGLFKPIPVTAASRPITVQPDLVDQTVRGQITGAVFTMQPIAEGSLTMLDIAPTATSYTMQQEIVDGAGGFTGTNGTITRTIDSAVRLVTIRATCNMRNLQAAPYYILYTGVECHFPKSPAEADTGNTMEVPLKVYGSISDPVFLA